jgi:hypothetical protein
MFEIDKFSTQVYTNMVGVGKVMLCVHILDNPTLANVRTVRKSLLNTELPTVMNSVRLAFEMWTVIYL